MSQQVNLYQPILRREKKVFSAVTMLQTLALIAALMLLMYAVNHWQLQQLDAENAQLQAQQRSLTEQVTTLSRELQSRPESRELRAEAETLRRELDLKRDLLDLMRNRSTARTNGFSESFAGLARQRVDGLWLTGIELHNSEARHVALRGMTSRAELVPQLVKQLGAEPAFQGLRFRHLRVFQPEGSDSGNVLEFELTTEPHKEEAR